LSAPGRSRHRTPAPPFLRKPVSSTTSTPPGSPKCSTT
jgi:hypothetical protein